MSRFFNDKKEIYSNELFAYVKLYQDDDKRLIQIKNHMIENDPVNRERKLDLELGDVINTDNKALSKLDWVFIIDINKK